MYITLTVWANNVHIIKTPYYPTDAQIYNS